MPITQLNSFSRMTRLVAYVCVLALMAGCIDPNLVDEGFCVESSSSSYKLEVNNSSDMTVDIASTAQFYDASSNARSVGFDKGWGTDRVLARTQNADTFNILIDTCIGFGLPAANRMVYPLFLLTLHSAEQSRHYLAVGGSQHDYETYVRNQLTLPEGTEVLGYGYLYTPGETIRQELGLPANNSGATAAYTDLDPDNKVHNASDFILKLKIDGDNSSDMHWGFSNDPRYTSLYNYAIPLNLSPQSTNQAYPASGSSGSSAAR